MKSVCIAWKINKRATNQIAVGAMEHGGSLKGSVHPVELGYISAPIIKQQQGATADAAFSSSMQQQRAAEAAAVPPTATAAA